MLHSARNSGTLRKKVSFSKVLLRMRYKSKPQTVTTVSVNVRMVHHFLTVKTLFSCKSVNHENRSYTYLTGRLAWSRRSTVGVGPTPYKWLLPELALHLSRERASLAPFSRISGVGHSGSWPPLHCRDSKHLHRRSFPAPHCTLRLSHLSVGGNARGSEIVSQPDM